VLLKLKLEAFSGDRTLEFEWDPETGELKGRDAAEVRRLIAEAVRSGSIVIHPQPTVYEITTDPLRDPEAFAAVIGTHYRLPPELTAVYPKRGHRVPRGAIP
jgi:hypothetical protein